MIKKQGLQKFGADSTWFLDSYALHHLCNDRKLFNDLKAKNINFITAAGQVIQIVGISTVFIQLADGNSIKLHNVALAPGYNLNLISLG